MGRPNRSFKLAPYVDIGVDLNFAIIAQYANRVAVTIEQYYQGFFKGGTPNKEYFPAEVAEAVEGHYLVCCQKIFLIFRDSGLSCALILLLGFVHAYLRENVATIGFYKDSTALINVSISNVTADWY